MNDFNYKLERLIKEANEHGYEFTNGIFEQTKSDKIPVMETFFINNGVYESYGYWTIYKKTTRISNEDYKKILELGEKYSFDDYKIDYSTKYEGFYKDVIADIVCKYDKSNIDFTDGSRGGTIQVNYEEYFEYFDRDGETEYVDLWFIKEDDDCDFPRGYISFYEMPMCDFKKAEDINLEVTKYIKYN